MGALLQDWSLLASKGVVGAHQKLLAAQRTSRVETVPNYYAVLGVEKSAPGAAIRSAFRCFIKSSLPACNCCCLTQHYDHSSEVDVQCGVPIVHTCHAMHNNTTCHASSALAKPVCICSKPLRTTPF